MYHPSNGVCEVIAAFIALGYVCGVTGSVALAVTGLSIWLWGPLLFILTHSFRLWADAHIDIGDS